MEIVIFYHHDVIQIFHQHKYWEMVILNKWLKHEQQIMVDLLQSIYNMEPPNLFNGYPDSFPMTIILENDPINNQLFVYVTNPSWGTFIQKCGYHESFDNDQGLNIYFAVQDNGQYININTQNQTKSPTNNPTTNPSVNPSVNPSLNATNTPTCNP